MNLSHRPPHFIVNTLSTSPCTTIASLNTISLGLMAMVQSTTLSFPNL